MMKSIATMIKRIDPQGRLKKPSAKTDPEFYRFHINHRRVDIESTATRFMEALRHYPSAFQAELLHDIIMEVPEGSTERFECGNFGLREAKSGIIGSFSVTMRVRDNHGVEMVFSR